MRALVVALVIAAVPATAQATTTQETTTSAGGSTHTFPASAHTWTCVTRTDGTVCGSDELANADDVSSLAAGVWMSFGVLLVTGLGIALRVGNPFLDRL